MGFEAFCMKFDMVMREESSRLVRDSMNGLASVARDGFPRLHRNAKDTILPSYAARSRQSSKRSFPKKFCNLTNFSITV